VTGQDLRRYHSLHNVNLKSVFGESLGRIRANGEERFVAIPDLGNETWIAPYYVTVTS
jgi:hypothetical protein